MSKFDRVVEVFKVIGMFLISVSALAVLIESAMRRAEIDREHAKSQAAYEAELREYHEHLEMVEDETAKWEAMVKRLEKAVEKVEAKWPSN